MKRIEYHNREKEIKEIANMLEHEPSLITFIYGPLNSGKTELTSYIVKQLPEAYAKAILKDLKLISGFPVPLNLFEQMLEQKARSRDVKIDGLLIP